MQEDCYFEHSRASEVYVHESSYVDSPCRIGSHTSILHFSHIMAHAIIGSFCQIGRHVVIESGVMVGDYVCVMNNTQLNSGVILENYVYCGSSVVFDEGNRVRAMDHTVSKISPTLVREGALISANATVASGYTIGQYAFVEAGSIVDRNIPDFAIVYGNPIKLAGWRCKCGKSLSITESTTEVKCQHCSRYYARQSPWKIIPLISKSATSKPDQNRPEQSRLDNRSDSHRMEPLDSHFKPDTTVRDAQGFH
jgi:UDP-2-acetamido-3-amino-2,3-dideoxy-glucuronate N-acetyltransferase